MNSPETFLVLGATGQTGQHFTSIALQYGHRVRALARTPAKLTSTGPDLDVRQSSITDPPDLDRLLTGVDAVVAMLGDVQAQKAAKINTSFVEKLVPAMRRAGVARFLYQAGGLSAAPGQRLAPALWTIRNTVARGYIGQHEDNEAVMRYLTDDAGDIDWVVHRAGIGSDGPSKGVLERSAKTISIATFRRLRVLQLPVAVRSDGDPHLRPQQLPAVALDADNRPEAPISSRAGRRNPLGPAR